MSKGKSVVIIGGGACGPKTAARLRRLDPAAKITMVQDESIVSYAACGLPYFISGQVGPRDMLIVRNADDFKKISNVDVLTGTRVDGIDRAGHKLNVTDLSEQRSYTIDYDKLVIATGAGPIVPRVPGIDLKGIHLLKSIPDADEILELIKEAHIKKAVIVGAGLIGVEMAEALTIQGFEVTIVEALDKVLAALLDDEISDMVAKHLKDKAVILKLGQKITGFAGKDGRVTSAITDSETIPAEIAIVAIGIRPESKLAKEAGLETGPRGDITVDDYLQTSDPDIYAGGDCIANLSIVTGQKMLAANGSTANKHGHIIAANLAGAREKFPGIVASACVKVFDFNVGRVGITERQAREMGIKFTAAMAAGPDKPGYYPGSKEIIIKLIVNSENGRILGAQGVGPGEVIKRIDVMAAAITMGMTVDMLANLDLCYAPPYNSALDVLHHTANLVRNKLAGRVAGVKPAEVKEKIDKKESFLLLDVRDQVEIEETRIAAPQTAHVPLPSLYTDMDKLPMDRKIVVICQRGARAYQAICALNGSGFKDAKFMEGSLTCWCGDVIGKPIL
ncbi:MAG: FAD-dependent oxidoreductase [Dehalococcoidia bacterium]|nr:FAD-dependent oxidoreductase [Dehalococcoidia bacterium]